ncbi:MAG: phosphotransferase [Chloroflexi bacterium]|nr:phosphotransferase [Chloroflexota bacterium]
MPQQEPENLQDMVLRASAEILTTYFKTAIHVQLHEEVVIYEDAPYHIFRLAIKNRPATAPATVIVKVARENAAPQRFEWVALEFLNGVTAVHAIVPKFYGGSTDPALLVMEDFGSGDDQTLGHFLDGMEPPETVAERTLFQHKFAPHAEAGLIAFQRALGQLHGATVEMQDVYERFRKQRGASVRSRHKVHDMVAVLRSFVEKVEMVGLSISAQAMVELETAVSHIQSPGAFLTFTHGDTTPANFFYQPNNSRFIDFETGEFRHALLDGTYSRLRYLHSVWARYIPVDLQKRMFTVYREELGKGCAAALDDAQFLPAFAACSAGWMAGLCQFMPRVMIVDRRWGRSTIRQRIVAGLDHFVVLADEFSLYPALAETCQQMAHQLRQRWPEPDCTLPIYCAFE